MIIVGILIQAALLYTCGFFWYKTGWHARGTLFYEISLRFLEEHELTTNEAMACLKFYSDYIDERFCPKPSFWTWWR